MREYNLFCNGERGQIASLDELLLCGIWLSMNDDDILTRDLSAVFYLSELIKHLVGCMNRSLDTSNYMS